MTARAIFVLLLLLEAPAPATEKADSTGLWAVRAGDTTIFRIEVRRTGRGWTGAWIRPEHFDSDGDSFTGVAGPVVRRVAVEGHAIEGEVELRFDDPQPHSTPDVLQIRASDAGHAELRYIGAGLDPFALVRASASAPLGPWDAKRRYTRVVERSTNAEMTAMFDTDQQARQGTIDWRVVREQDRQRRLQTQMLLDTGALASGDDFYHAAFIFQHGDKPEDYLKAHILATIATARGKPTAVWIAAATLDRNLQSIGRPQVLGTQFLTDKPGTTTQGAYDRTLLSDALRDAMHVPPLAAQEERRREIERDFTPAPVKAAPTGPQASP